MDDEMDLWKISHFLNLNAKQLLLINTTQVDGGIISL